MDLRRLKCYRTKKKKEIPEADTEEAVTNVENFNIGYSC